MKKPVITLKNICKVYKTKHVITKALDNINIEIFEGEFVTLTGSSGCGKSTLLSIIGLLNDSSSGSYYLAEHNIKMFSANQLARIRNKHLGFIFQSFNLIDELNVLENASLPLKFQGLSKMVCQQEAMKLLIKLGLEKRATHYPNQLSGGQQQRVAIARALICKPDIILADEPTGNLDSDTGKVIMKILCDLHKNGQTILMVTHELEHTQLSTRSIVLKDGKIN